MASIIMDIHENGAIDIQQLEKLSYIKSFHQTLFAEQENELLYVLGLFYKTKDPESFFEACYQVYADVIKNETQENFTPIQADILEHIKKHKFFSFSAPTSVGKSYLFRYLITNAKNDVVVVVPSRALITEYILEITRVVDKDVLVLQFIDDINKTNTNRRIFVVTPERARELFKLKNRFNIELFLFDEAQIAEEYMRGMLFDALVRRINTHFPDSKKIFAHPFIENPEAQFIKHNINTDTGKFLYNQQSVGKIYMSLKDDKLSYFSPFESEKLFDKIPETSDIIYEKLKTDGTTLLVYISKENIYNGSCLEKFKKYIELCPKIIDADALKIIEEFRDFIGAEENAPSVMIDMMKRGIVIHHGSIPLYGRLLIEKFVKLGFAKICFATSTLIQGINMPFDMVWIDKFQFNGSETDKVIGLKNLIGRAGRTSLNQSFDYGYVIIPDSHIKSFSERLKKIAKLNEESELNKKVETIEEDLQDVVEAIQKDTFNDEYMMPEIQIERMKNADIDADIQYILDNLLSNNLPLKWQ
ncbi:MAG: DEAD/DEAH box helicase [Alphaproteobacteria bacterium]|nr:DEAD/DEAH box helicase [Alphaproteobacteria bacterium]